MLTASFNDYEFLMTMPLSIRKYAALGYFFFTALLGIFLHFAFRTVHGGNMTEPRIIVVVCIYLWVMIIGAGFSVVLLVPKLRKKRWYQWLYFSFSLVSGGIAGVMKIFDHLDIPDFLMFLGGALLMTYGMKYLNKASSLIADEKARLEREQADRKSEMTAAQTMQRLLLPTQSLATKEYQLFGKTIPSTEVGGDYFDVVLLDNGKLTIAIGDVSGHNIAAGLLMAMTKSAFRTELKYHSHDGQLPNLLQSLNNTVLENTARRMFVSFECAVFDFTTATVQIANAGHGMVARLRGQEVRLLQPKGIALGLAAQGVFNEEICDFQPNDVFLFFTDGIVEAMSKYKEEFGIDRIFTVVQSMLIESNGEINMEKIFNSVINAVRTFSGTESFVDDVTLVVMRVC